MLPISWKPTPRQVLIISIATLLLWIFLIEFGVLSYTKGVWVYPQDEAYIRMAIAKNFAFNHVWGLAKNEFSPSVSSILYPIGLAGVYFIFGSHLIIPFIVNLAAAIALLIVVQKWLLKEEVSPWYQLWILLGMIILIPLPVLVVIGMEHVLQILFSFLFIYHFSDWVGKEPASSRAIPKNLFIYGILMTATRYEGVFIVMIACLLLLFKKRFLSAVLIGLISTAPLIIFGLYSLSRGGYFVPNSVLIKSFPIPFNADGITKFISEDIIDKLFYAFPTRGSVAAERIMIIIPILFALYWGLLSDNKRYRYILFFCLSVTILHLVFANALFFYRYEAYLIGCAIPIFGVLLSKSSRFTIPRRNFGVLAIGVWAGLMLVYPFLYRSWDAYKDTGKGCINMFEQDYLAAQFLHRYYDKTTIVIDDLGAMSYLTEGKKIDLNNGIGFMEITKSRVEQYYRPEYLDFVVSKVRPKIAVVLEKKYNPWLLHKWQKVAAWHTYNVLEPMGDKFLCFYAVDSSAAPALKKQLEEYEPLLPPGVKAGYYYAPTAMK